MAISTMGTMSTIPNRKFKQMSDLFWFTQEVGAFRIFPQLQKRPQFGIRDALNVNSETWIKFQTSMRRSKKRTTEKPKLTPNDSGENLVYELLTRLV